MFIAFTMTAGTPANPITGPVFVNAFQIRAVWPRTVVHGHQLTAPEGTYILTGTSNAHDENIIPVAESYGEVTGAIKDALRV